MDMERALLALLLACALASAGSAQPEEPPQGGYDGEAAADEEMRVNMVMIALLAAVVAVFVFIVASIIYLRHCTGGYSYGSADARGSAQPTGFSSFIARQQQRRAATSRGLAAEVVEAFPTMRYVEAKALRVGKKAAPPLECAVCLSEFEDENMLRLLPKCSHAFHPDCIGEWLVSHVTCPVCRRNLDPSKGAGSNDETSNPNPNPPPPLEANSAVARHHQADGVARPSAVVIDVVTEEAEQRRKEAMELQRIGNQRRAMRSRSRPAGAKAKAKPKLVRSYSTGHPLAVVRLDRDLERFTLRLPEHVRREMVASGEQSAHRRGQRAGRWPSLLRYTQTLSGRFFSTPRRTDSSSTDGGEVSSTSWTRIRGNRVAAVDVVDGSAMGGSVAVDVDKDKAASRQVRS